MYGQIYTGLRGRKSEREGPKKREIDYRHRHEKGEKGGRSSKSTRSMKVRRSRYQHVMIGRQII